MSLFREDSKFSIRRFIALSWTIVIITITLAVVFEPTRFKLASETFLVPITMTIWVSYFGKKKMTAGIEKMKEKINNVMVDKGDGVIITKKPYQK